MRKLLLILIGIAMTLCTTTVAQTAAADEEDEIYPPRVWQVDDSVYVRLTTGFSEVPFTTTLQAEDAADWEVVSTAGSGADGDYGDAGVYVDTVTPSRHGDTWKFLVTGTVKTAEIDYNRLKDSWQSQMDGYLSVIWSKNGGEPQQDGGRFTLDVVGDGHLSLQGPTRISSGAEATLTGNLECFQNSEYVPANHNNVRIDFRPLGSSAWKTIGTVEQYNYGYSPEGDDDGWREQHSGQFTFKLPSINPLDNRDVAPAITKTGDWRAVGPKYWGCMPTTSNTVRITIGPSAPTAPRTLKATPAARTTKMAWVAPSSNGGAAVSGYQAKRDSNGKTVSLKSNARSYNFTGLKTLTKYTFYVRAKNSAGWGPWASVSTTTKAPASKAYKNCAALNTDYPHGVGKPGAVDKTTGVPVTNFHRNKKTYEMNDGRNVKKKQYDLDRDNDGIACEKK